MGSVFHADGPACENARSPTWSLAAEVDRLTLSKTVDQNVTV